MDTKIGDEKSYYAEHGAITDPAGMAWLFDELSADVSQLTRTVQGLLLHVFWAERYGVELSKEREAEVGIRHVEKMLARILEINDSPLSESRDSDERLIGDCRTFSVLMAAVLRHHNIPARARCGFGRYFVEDWHEDHWICEYWNNELSRWIMVDAQIDEFQREKLGIIFDTLDVPRNQFIVGGKAWNLCRTGETNPDNFGIFDMRGLWFIRGDFIRDIAALNKVELLPWDGWGLIDREDTELSAAELDQMDQMATKTFDQVDFTYVRDVYESDSGYRVPPVFKSYGRSKTVLVDLLTEEIVG